MKLHHTLCLQLILLISCSISFAQQSFFDWQLPTKETIISSLQITREVMRKTDLTSLDVYHIYFAEKSIGKCILGLSLCANDSEQLHNIRTQEFIKDTSLTNECVSYIQANKDHFKIVEDGYKGEENFWEPSGYWLSIAQKRFPDSVQTKEIEFDFDFNAFIRQYNFDDEGHGKTCEQCVQEELEMGGDELRKNYSDGEIKNWVPQCEQVRKYFEEGRRKLLEKYNNAPFTKKLGNIDVTTIVVFHGVC